MKVFTKLFLTFALLCFAGVVNAATEYEVDQKFTSVAALEGQLFAIVNETDGKAIYNKDAQNLAYDTYANAIAGTAYLYKLHSLAEESDANVQNAYAIEVVKADGSSIGLWGNPAIYLNSGAEGGFDGCFVLGNKDQYGTDVKYGGAWEIEYAEGQGFALKNVARGGYFAGVNPAPTGTDPIYWTLCTMKEAPQTDPLAEQKDALTAAIATGKMYFAVAYTEATFSALSTAITDGEAALAAEGATAESLTNATTAINNAIAALALKDGFTNLTAEMFLTWDSATEPTTGATTGCSFELFKPSGLPYGDGSVGWKNFALLSDYDKLYVTFTEGTPRVMMNRDVDQGQWNEDETQSHLIEFPKGDAVWSAKYFTNENGVVTVDLKQIVADKGLASLNAIKGANWANVTVTGLFLYKEAAASEGTEVTIVPSDLPATTSAEFNASKGDVNISCTQGTINADQIRIFKNQTITFSSTKAIKKIVFTCTANGAAQYGPGCFNVQEGYTFEAEGNTGTWEGSAASVSFKAETNQVRITQVVITLGDETVEPVHIANTIDDPYTVAKAVELIDAGEALSETVFVKGIISKIDKVNIDEEDATKSYITYWISDNGSEEGQQFECYKGLSKEGLALADIEVGAEVIVTGKLTKYNDIYEFSAGNAIVAYVAPVKPLFADGKYYILNKGTEKYLAAGSNWGTHAFVNAEGLDYTLAFADGKYTLDSQVSNGGNNHFLNGEWNDGAAMGWTFAEVAEGVYTISNGTAYLTAGEDGRVTLAADATVAAAQWTLVAAADRDAANLATLEAATAENGVDATFLVKGANFNRNDLRNQAWTATKSGGNQTIAGPSADRATYGCESWNNTFEVSQTIENLPDGIYEFTIAGYGTNGTTKIFANDTEVAFVNTESAANFGAALDEIAAGSFTGNTTGKVTVIGGILKIGVKRTEQVGADWAVFDNARLTYFGAPSADAYEPAYTAALAAAQAALADADYAAVTGDEKAALEKAIADYETIAEPTVDLYKEAIAALTAATTAFKDAKAAYEALIAAKAAKAEFDFAAYPYASEAKKAAAEATLTAEAKNAADAKAKTEGIDKAFRQYAESSALLECQYGAAVNMTESIVNPNAEEAIAEPWAIVKGESSGGNLSILDGEPLTDGEGKNYKYFDGGDWGANAWDVALEQTISLPAGKYYLTVAGRASADVDMTLFAGENTAKIAAIGNQGGLFGRGWGDASVEFEMAEAGDIKIGVRGVTSAVHNWMSFTRFRLMQFGVAGEDAPELEAPEGWTNEIANGNLAGDNVANYFAKEYPSTEIVNASIVAMAGKDNSRGIVVKAGDDTANSGAQAWDSQFWIQLNEKLPDGTKLHVEFDYKASKAAKASTQAHGAPGAYLHWAMIGDVNFTTEWQHFSTDVTVEGSMANMESIAFNLQEEKSATEYYFDNFGVWAQKPAPIEDWTDIVVNGDMEGADMVNFFVTEQGVGGPFVATATEGIGKDGSKAVKVQSADSPANNWATQFFIRLPYQLPAGTKYKVSFDYKADKAGGFETQSHAEPGQYIHWAAIGSGNFTTEWQTYTAEGSVPAECDGSTAQKTFQTIAFNLALNQTATEFIFDNVKFEVPANIVETLVLNPYIGKDADELEAPEGWTKAITNGNLAGDDVTSFVSKEYPSSDIVPATIVPGAGKDYSRGIVVKAGDDTGNDKAVAWDSQFWIQLNEKLTEGTKVHIEFDYKASQAAKGSTQAHSNPGNYLHWAMMGDVNFTTEWQHFSADVDVTAAMAKGDNGNGSGDGLFSIAFNLQEEKSATDYFFDNFGVWYQLPVVDGINAMKNEMNAKSVYNLNGQKVNVTKKGLYIMNGKKVVVK